MEHELVKYEGVDPVKETVVRRGELDQLYNERDILNGRSHSLTQVRYGVRPVLEKKS